MTFSGPSSLTPAQSLLSIHTSQIVSLINVVFRSIIIISSDSLAQISVVNALGYPGLFVESIVPLQLYMVGCTFFNNSVPLYAAGAYVNVTSAGSVSIQNCSFVANSMTCTSPASCASELGGFFG